MPYSDVLPHAEKLKKKAALKQTSAIQIQHAIAFVLHQTFLFMIICILVRVGIWLVTMEPNLPATKEDPWATC
jgi:hypothetical protein